MAMAAVVPARDYLPNARWEYDQWTCWPETARDGKPTKVPTYPTTGEFASRTDRETWDSFETICSQVESGEEQGVGIDFTADEPFVGVHR